MVKIFWAQNQNPNLPNTLINYKGEIFELNKDEIIGQELFDELLHYQELSIPLYDLGNLKIKKYNEGGYFISSNFIEEDDLNRKLGFMFFTQNTKKSEVISDLCFFSNQIKRSLTNEDITNIDKGLGKELNKANKQIIKLIAAAVVVVLLIYAIWKEIS